MTDIDPTEHPRSEPRPGRLALRAAGATVAAALVGVVIGVGFIQVRYDDPAPVTAAPPAPTTSPISPTPTAAPFGAKSNGSHFGSLRDLLLPATGDYGLGPDDGSYGNDTELTGEKLKAGLDDDLVAVPKAQQDKLRQYWESLHVRAIGVRTYKNRLNSLVVGIKLHQFNQQEVQKTNEYTAVFTGDTGLFRTGPAVPGHPEAHCYLMPAAPSAPIDRMECSAAEGDLLVVLNAEGVAPLPKDAIVTLLTRQLDRLARPGASV
ncbi:hypothetical protein [Kitasatospora purpeofusca]|uniref:hypothetical protein n=1 Tax=Kitasatospora purpeofusca TaxID=67352 RepID=UPI002A5B11B0|nr:hypothetical protein [Kitasatospora purpeofusca]MDY0811202.1 hypothetical protein [Kitasatospora purpeofusca]